ncbi:aminopeptidase Q [Discoglossus pictus]
MGPKTSSGFYLSRTSAALLALLLAALLLALTVLGALYARSRAPELGSSTFTYNITTLCPFLVNPASGTTELPSVWDKPRLPHHLVPLHYDLELWPRMHPDGEQYPFTGQVNITIKCLEGTDLVLLHSSQLHFSRVELKLLEKEEEEYQSLEGNTGHQEGISHLQGAPGIGATSQQHIYNISIKEVLTPQELMHLAVILEEPLVAGRLYLLHLDYSGFLSDDFTGLFLTSYTDFNESKVLVASELEPTYARAVYPCFDEPAMKATFKIRLVHNSSYVALSNMPAIAMSEREDVNGTIWTVTTFNTTLPMSTYITAFVIFDFDYINTTERGHEIRVWARKEVVQNGYADFALSIAGPILTYMEDVLNVSYPLQKTDLVALPDFGVSGMENWGLIIFLEASLSYNPNKKFSDSKALISLIVAHEIGHQWFGNLVTMKWWNDIWLNEGFASYMEYLGANFIDPKLKLNELFVMHNLQYILERDSQIHRRSVSAKQEDINAMRDIISLFDMFSYCKGAALIRMIPSFLTEKLFNKGISSYLKTFSFSNVDQEDLWSQLQMAIDDQNEVQLPTSLKMIMDSWTWKEGMPLLTLNTSTGEMTEEQFTIDTPDNNTSYDNHTWIVPVTWIKNGLQQPIVWLDNRTKQFPEMKIAPGENWIILNINITGYYRVNYDEKNWNHLAQLLEKDPKALPVVNRVQLFDDAFLLANFDYIEYETVLNLTRYLGKEDELIVWYTVLRHMYGKYSLVTYSSFPLVKKYILKRIYPVFQRYASMIRNNFDETADDFFIHTQLSMILKAACTLGMQDCLDLARDLFTQWMKNPSNNTIPYSIRNAIYCYAISVGNEKEWEFAWEMYNKSHLVDNIEASHLLYGMSCTKEPWLLYRFLKDFQSDAHVYIVIFLDVIKNDIGRHIAWEFIKENWQRVNELLRQTSYLYNTLFSTLMWKSTSDLQFQEIQMFINATMPEIERQEVLESLEKQRKTSLEWTTKVNTKILDWFQKNTKDSDF